MTILLERFTVPERGAFELNLQQWIEIQVTAEEARRKVNLWLMDYVSYMMRAETPILVISEQAVWRVPAFLTSPDIGTVGKVGEIDVNIQSGQIHDPEGCKERILCCARALAKNLPPYQPHKKVPEQFIPKHLPPARLLQLPEDDE